MKRFGIILFVIALAAGTARAGTVTWDGSTDTTWTQSDSTSWGGATYQSNDIAQFSGAGQGIVTVDGGGVTPGGVTITSGSYTFTGGSIGGTGTVTKSGLGTLRLSGTNTYSGRTVISAGTLCFTNSDNLGAAGSIIIFNGPAALSFGPNYDWAFASGGTPDLGAHPITLTNGAVAGLYYNTANTTMTVSDAITGNGGIIWGRDPVVTFGGGSGGEYANLLSTSNTFTGPMTIGVGSENIGTGCDFTFNSLADSSSAITFNVGGGNTFSYGAGAVTNLSVPNRPINLLNSNTTLRNMNATYTMTLGPVSTSTTGSKTLNLGASGAGCKVAGAITDGSGVISLTKSGSGSVYLSATNTYSGATTVSGGWLYLSGRQALSKNTSITINDVSSTSGALALLADGIGTITLTNTVTKYSNQTSSYGYTTIFVGNNSTANGGTSSGTSVGSTIAIGPYYMTGGPGVTGYRTVVDGANNYRLQLNGVYSAANYGGMNVTFDFRPTANVKVTLSGTITQLSGNPNGNIQFLGLDGSSTGNLVDGTIIDPVDYPTNTNARALGVTKTSTSEWTLSGTNTYTGTNTLTAGTLSISKDVNLGSSNSLVFNGGTLRITGTNLTSYASGKMGTHPVTLVAAKTVGFDIADASHTFTISQVLDQGTGGLTKLGAGTLALTAVNTYSGATTINGGTLKLKNTGTGLTQSLGPLSLAGADITLHSENAGSGSLITTFTTLSRTAGSSANIIFTGGNNTINLTAAAGFLDKGVFFGGAEFAALAALNGNVRALVYGTDPSAVAINTITANNHVKLTSTPGVQNGLTFYSLCLSGDGVNYTQNGGQTLTVPAILKSGGGTNTISGGIALTGGSGTELVIRTDTNSDVLAVSTPVTGTGALTKSGAGRLTLFGVNTYTGASYINGGIFEIGGNGSLSNGNYAGGIRINSGASFNFNSSVAQTLSGVISGEGSLAFGGSGRLTLTATNTYSGATTITNGTFEIAGSGMLGSGIYAAGIINNGTFIYSSMSTQAITGAISGNGSLTKSGSGSLVLTGANSYKGKTTVSGGTLSISSACLSEWAAVEVATGAKLELNFSGTNIIRRLIFNGGDAPAGVWGGVGAGGAYTNSLLTGSGFLKVPAARGSVFVVR